jgi:hypothetical protein
MIEEHLTSLIVSSDTVSGERAQIKIEISRCALVMELVRMRADSIDDPPGEYFSYPNRID